MQNLAALFFSPWLFGVLSLGELIIVSVHGMRIKGEVPTAPRFIGSSHPQPYFLEAMHRENKIQAELEKILHF